MLLNITPARKGSAPGMSLRDKKSGDCFDGNRLTVCHVYLFLCASIKGGAVVEVLTVKLWNGSAPMDGSAAHGPEALESSRDSQGGVGSTTISISHLIS